MAARRAAVETCVTADVDQLSSERPAPAGGTVVIES